MWLLVLGVGFVVGIGVGIGGGAVVLVRGLRPFRRRSRGLLRLHVRLEGEGVVSCCCCLLVDRSRIVRGSGDSRCRPMLMVRNGSRHFNASITYRQNGELVHVLSLTCRDHIFQHAKFFVHLRSPSSLDEAMRRLPCNLASCRSCTLARLLFITSRLGGIV
jgi:hypothetical protein